MALQVPRSLPQQRTRALWQTPPSACFKINFNGATFVAENKFGIEVVIQDSQCMVIASLSQLLPHEFQAVEIEALAATRALEFALELGITHVVLEGDSKVVMDALAEGDVSLSSYGLLIANAKSVSHDFFQLLYSHVKRECTKVTHSLARHAIIVSSFIVWIESVSPQVAFVY